MAKMRYLAAASIIGFGVFMFGSLVVGGTIAWQKASQAVTASCGCGQGIVVPASHTWWPTVSLFALAAVIVWRGMMAWREQQRGIRRMTADFAVAGRRARTDAQGRPYVEVGMDDPFAVTIGGWRSTVYVSRGLTTSLSGDELAAVLAHEFGHQRAHHAWWSRWQQGIVRTFFSWSWLQTLARMAQAEQEVAADAYAGQQAESISALASALLKLQLAPQPHGVSWSAFETRIDHLVNPRARSFWPRSVLLALSGEVVVLVAVFGLSWGAVKAAEPVMSAMPTCRESRRMCAQNALTQPMTTLQSSRHVAP